MVRDYENELHLKFLLPSQPNKGNFASWAVYKSTLATYQHDHNWVVEARDCWKQSKQVEDVHQEAEAARVWAATEKEQREAMEQLRKHPHLEDDIGMSASAIIACCKGCIARGECP